MTRFIRRRLPVIAVLAVLLAGGAVAAMAAGGSTRPAGHAARAHHKGTAAPPRGRRLLQSAAGYIGVSPEVVEQGLQSGKSLGQLATEAGKSEAGLVQALATTARAGLEQRLTQAVKQPGALHGLHRHGHFLRVAAAGYLGITPSALSAQLHAGKTLAHIADATPGHSRAALIDALVAARQAQGPSVAHVLKPSSKGSAQARAAKLRRRVSAFVDHGHAAKPKHTTGG
jgi:hypothetical protein